jgi:CDP-diglyceride synthetase
MRRHTRKPRKPIGPVRAWGFFVIGTLTFLLGSVYAVVFLNDLLNLRDNYIYCLLGLAFVVSGLTQLNEYRRYRRHRSVPEE